MKHNRLKAYTTENICNQQYEVEDTMGKMYMQKKVM